MHIPDATTTDPLLEGMSTAEWAVRGVAEDHGRSSLAILSIPARSGGYVRSFAYLLAHGNGSTLNITLDCLKIRNSEHSDGGVDFMLCSKVCKTDLRRPGETRRRPRIPPAFSTYWIIDEAIFDKPLQGRRRFAEVPCGG